MSGKAVLRKEILGSLKQMDPKLHYSKSNQIHISLLKEESIQNAEIIGITLSSFPEVGTWELIEKLWTAGKQIAVPKCRPSTRAMDFYIIETFDQLETVYMKLKEPIPHITKKVEAAQIDVQIIPGVVFDCKGYRIGFGGGYYDRYLSDYRGTTIALAFDCQIIDRVPSEHFDIPVSCILTETKKIVCSISGVEE